MSSVPNPDSKWYWQIAEMLFFMFMIVAPWLVIAFGAYMEGK